jgi:putative hydrolase of the HAD superfamily
MNQQKPYRGLLLDVLGVLTTDIFAAVGSYCERLGLPRESFFEAIALHPYGRQLYHDVERGEVSQVDFEQGIASVLGVESKGLIQGLLANTKPNPPILEAARDLRGEGVKVGVVTNSWGTEPHNFYEAYELTARFDAVVISSDVGFRKPDPPIYALAAERLHVAPSACVYVDDIDENLPPAESIGMAVIHHVDNETTLQELERLFSIRLREAK